VPAFFPSSTRFTRAAQSVDHLRQIIEPSIRLNDQGAIVRSVQSGLEEALAKRLLALDDRFFEIKAGSYARRLLLRGTSLLYTVAVMTWAAGQATPIHDHSGIWCVEGILAGEMKVTRFKLIQQRGELFFFSAQPSIHAAVGSSGSLIPPDEYHVLENGNNSTAVTIHVYGGEMDHCNIYSARSDGWYERSYHQLGYDS